MARGAGVVAELWGRARRGQVRDALVDEEEGPPYVIRVAAAGAGEGRWCGLVLLPLVLLRRRLVLRREPPEEPLVLQPRGLVGTFVWGEDVRVGKCSIVDGRSPL